MGGAGAPPGTGQLRRRHEQGDADPGGEKNEGDADAGEKARAFAARLEGRFGKRIHAATIEAASRIAAGRAHENRERATCCTLRPHAGAAPGEQGILARP